MKISLSVLFLFFLASIHSQEKIENLTSITLYKPYYRFSCGSCNQFIEEGANIASKQITDCDDLVLGLIEIQKKKKTWKHQASLCAKGSIGGPNIENMVVYRFNKLIDTLYFTHYKDEYTNTTILFDYRKGKEYIDTKNEIITILNTNKNLKKILVADIPKLYMKIVDNPDQDSISVNNLKINNANLYGHNRKKIDSLIGGFGNYVEIEKDIRENTDSYKYFNTNQDAYGNYYFVNDSPIDKIEVLPIVESGDQYPDYEIFNINGITFNDSEQKLVRLFPNSTHHLKEIKEFFKNENGDYTVSVKLNDKKGNIDFILNNEKIKKIVVDFYYPKKQ